MQELRPDEAQPDAAFTELTRPYSMVHRVLSISIQGTAYTLLSIAAFILWLPLTLMPYLLMVGVLSEIGMAYTHFRVRHQPFGGVMALLMLPLIFLVVGFLVRFRTWIIVTRQNLKWYRF